jgi:hypothetical protein
LTTLAQAQQEIAELFAGVGCHIKQPPRTEIGLNDDRRQVRSSQLRQQELEV